MPQITANGITLNYQFDGPEDQPVLLFSNSLASNLHMWDPQVPAVAGDFRVLRYDSRGHGGSDAPAADYTIDQLADDALALLDALEIEKVFYCGLSKGGMVGQKLASRNPDRLHAAVLCATSSYMGPPDLWQGRIDTARAEGMGGGGGGFGGLGGGGAGGPAYKDATELLYEQDGKSHELAGAFCGHGTSP
ncbi:MAG: alpha/beta fold hydrolase, partial [Alphaproteobacteria bacterium]|nr:alpha/beta fold hydrolase [Alphaproteobacteria bacterium]